MFWYFAFLAVIVWLYVVYLALLKRIDSAAEQLRQNIVEGLGALNQKPEAVAEKEPADDLDARARKQIYKDFPRYGIHDDYTVSEIRRSYEREDSRGRVRLLRRVYAQGVHLPYEVAVKAVTDSDPLVREWMAKEAPYLDYREARYEGTGEQFTTTYVHPERDLVERLRQDPDPFIRAALRENPEVSCYGFWGDRWVEEFRNCVPLERLAMMRNKKLDFALVKLILNLDDTKLDLEMEERSQLAKACLVNEHVVQYSRRSRANDFVDGLDWYSAREFAEALWRLAAKWHASSGVPFFAFKNVQTNDEVKAEIYSRCQSTFLRQTILNNCFPEDKKTLALGRADVDPIARSVAYGRSRSMERGEIEEALRREKDGKEDWLVGSLLENPWLGSIARELHNAMGEAQVQPIPDGVDENIGQATQAPSPVQHREEEIDLPTEDRVTELFQEWQQGGKEGLRKAYQKEEEE